MNFDNLRSTPGADIMGGTKLIAYAALVEDIASMPALPAAPASMADYGTLEGNIVLNAGKKFIEIEAVPTTGKIDDNLIEGHGNGFESTYEFTFPGQTPTSIGFSRIGPTANWVVVVIDNDNQRRLMGIENAAKIISVAGTTGLITENNKGFTFQIKSYQHGATPVYVGLIDNDSGSGSGI